MATDLTHSFTVEQTPQQVFDAINDVRRWWSDNVVGDTATLGAEWVYLTPDIHFSKQRTTVLVPGERVEWLVVDSYLSFTEDKEEWTGTTIRFEITQPDGPQGRTGLTFTHVGLTGEVGMSRRVRDGLGTVRRRQPARPDPGGRRAPRGVQQPGVPGRRARGHRPGSIRTMSHFVAAGDRPLSGGCPRSRPGW